MEGNAPGYFQISAKIFQGSEMGNRISPKREQFSELSTKVNLPGGNFLALLIQPLHF